MAQRRPRNHQHKGRIGATERRCSPGGSWTRGSEWWRLGAGGPMQCRAALQRWRGGSGCRHGEAPAAGPSPSFLFSLPLLLDSSVLLSLGGGGEGENPWVARVLAPGPWGFYRRGARGRGGPDAGERRGCDGLTGRTRGGIRAPQRLSCVRGKGEARAARNRGRPRGQTLASAGHLAGGSRALRAVALCHGGKSRGARRA